VLVEEDGVAQHRARGQEAELVDPLDRRHAVPLDDLVDLEHALGDVQREGDATLLRGSEAVAQ
jgi:hypothetical protein